MATSNDISIQTPSALSTTPEIAAGVAQFLTPVVLECEALVVNGKQAHWHVRGGSFIGVHELLDEVIGHAQDFADTAAERVVALGLPLDARLETVAAKSTVPTLPDGFLQWPDTAAAWFGPDQVVERAEWALALAGRITQSVDPVELAAGLFGRLLTDTTRTAIARAPSPQEGLALLIASPEFMRR